MSEPSYVPRFIDETLSALLGEFPALLLKGARATGKTTSALRAASSVVRLDVPATAAAAAADPDALLRGLEPPVLIDEWQVVPSVLGAVKRAVDVDPRPGRFLLTGSARADLDGDAWPGTGRILRVPFHCLTVRERRGRAAGPSFIQRLLEGGAMSLPAPGAGVDLRTLVQELLVSGFPVPALHLPPHRRGRWLRSYASHVVRRDAPLAEPGRDPVRLGRYLEALAANTAGVTADTTLQRAGGVDRRTALAYERLLVGLGILEPVQAWWSNRMKRLAKARKRFLVDAGLAAALLRVDEEAIVRDGDLLGRLLETFVATQLRAEQILEPEPSSLHHLRTGQGRHEIDLLVERPDRSLIPIEVKATSAPRPSDARHLVWFAEQLPDRVAASVLFHSGRHVFPLAEGVYAVPIACLWA